MQLKFLLALEGKQKLNKKQRTFSWKGELYQLHRCNSFCKSAISNFSWKEKFLLVKETKNFSTTILSPLPLHGP